MAAIALAAVANAGLAYIGYGKVGAIAAGGVSIGSSLLHRWSESFSDDPAKALTLTETIAKSAVVDGRWIIGKPKFTGILVRSSEELFPASTPKTHSEVNWNDNIVSIPLFKDVGKEYVVKRQIIIFAENEIQPPEKIWIEGKEMPFVENNGRINVDFSDLDSRIEALKTRADNVIPPDERAEYNRGDRLFEHPNYKTYLDLLGQIAELEKQKYGFTYLTPGGQILSVVQIWMDYGYDSISPADIRCAEILAHLRSRITEDNTDYERLKLEIEQFGEFWDGSKDILQGLSWALVETRSWGVEKDNKSVNRLDWKNNPPKVDFLAQGMSSNPAEVIHWLLTDRAELEDDEIINYEIARGVCNEILILPNVQENVNTSPIDWQDVLKVLYPDAVDNENNLIVANLPSANTYNSALQEWNQRYTGPNNAEARYQCHGIITGSMLLKFDQVLQALGEAMGGWVINVGGKYKLIAGYDSDPILTITSDDITNQFISWSIGPTLNENVNAISADISQCKQDNYVKKSLGVIEDKALIEADGYSEWNAGVLPFCNNEIVGRRRMRTLLKRLTPGLLLGNFSIDASNDLRYYDLTAGDRININHELDGVKNKIFIIDNIQPINGTELALTVKEDPNSIYDNSFDLLGPGLVARREAASTENLGLDILAKYTWREVSVKAVDTVVFKDAVQVFRNSLNADSFDFDQDDVDEGSVLKKYVLDLEFDLGINIHEIQISLTIKSGAATNKIANIYNIQDDERYAGIAIRTFLDPTDDPYFWDRDDAGIITINATGQNDNNVLGPNYLFQIPFPSQDVLGDLEDVGARPPQSGVALRFDGNKGLWIGSQQIVPVDEIPEDTSEYLPFTLLGKNESVT